MITFLADPMGISRKYIESLNHHSEGFVCNQLYYPATCGRRALAAAELLSVFLSSLCCHSFWRGAGKQEIRVSREIRVPRYAL